MSTTEVQAATPHSRVGNVYMKLENQVIPVSDVDRSKQFYEAWVGGWTTTSLRWKPFASSSSAPGFWNVGHIRQGTHHGRAGLGAGSAGRLRHRSRACRTRRPWHQRGDVWHGPPFPVEARQPGVDPERASYGSFSSFNDPDGNLWLVQEVTTREPGRVTGAAFASTTDLEGALRRAESAHAEHEQGTATGSRPSWPSACATRTRRRGTPRTWWRSRPGQTCLRDRPGACRGWPAAAGHLRQVDPPYFSLRCWRPRRFPAGSLCFRVHVRVGLLEGIADEQLERRVSTKGRTGPRAGGRRACAPYLGAGSRQRAWRAVGPYRAPDDYELERSVA